MFMTPRLFFLLSIFLWLHAQCKAEDKAAIGTILAVIGKVKAINPTNDERDLRRGDAFYALDKIVVEKESKAQLKFIDGGMINLIEETEYRIDSYVFKETNKISESLSTLIKGGFRAISGAIAFENPTGTQIKTSLATLGLRGTIFEAVLKNERLSTGCEEGKIAVVNEFGEVDIGPSSKALYAIVIKGEAPLLSIKKPSDLAAVSFEIEGGETFTVQPRSLPSMPSSSVQPQTWPLPEPRSSNFQMEFYPQDYEAPRSKAYDYTPQSDDSTAPYPFPARQSRINGNFREEFDSNEYSSRGSTQGGQSSRYGTENVQKNHSWMSEEGSGQKTYSGDSKTPRDMHYDTKTQHYQEQDQERGYRRSSNYPNEASDYRKARSSGYPSEGGWYQNGGSSYPSGSSDYRKGSSSGYPSEGSGYQNGGSSYRSGSSDYRKERSSGYPSEGSGYQNGGSSYRSGSSDYRKGSSSGYPSEGSGFPSGGRGYPGGGGMPF